MEDLSRPEAITETTTPDAKHSLKEDEIIMVKVDDMCKEDHEIRRPNRWLSCPLPWMISGSVFAMEFEV